jgi:hypothetical protein
MRARHDVEGHVGTWHSETKLLRRNGNSSNRFRVEDFNTSKVGSNSVKFLVSNKRKIVFDNTDSYGHILMFWVDMAIKEMSLTKEKLVFVFAQSADHRERILEGSESLTKYLVKRFTDLGHEVEFIDDGGVVINNFVLYKMWHHITPDNGSKVGAFLSSGLDYSKLPSKKIYLSRGKTTTYIGNKHMTIPPSEAITSTGMGKYRNENKYKFTDRIDDEERVEAYFKSLGFEIVYPEDIESFADQLQLIASAKILASVTSSSLIASVVMAPNTCIVELSTPLDDNRIHSHYKVLSYVNSKNYLSISNYRVASELIESIEKNVAIKGFLLS